MSVCTSCNVEFEEDKKFCSYCGGPLTQKTEPMSAPKKGNRADEEKPEGKLYCPHCQITYEFGSSCIQCGSPLGRQTSPQEKGEAEIARGTQFEGKLPPVPPPQEQKTEAPRGKLICPTCKIIYERGTSCIKCESPLVPQNSTQTNGEPEISSGSEGEENRLQVQTIEEQLVPEIVVETPRKKLICPSCKIIYERGTSCVRCGAALVLQTSSKEKSESLDTKEKEKPKSTDTEFNLSTSEPDGLGDPFFPRSSTELSTASGRGPGVAPEQPPLPSPKGQGSDVIERGKKREIRATPAQELGIEEDFFQTEPSEQPVAKKSVGDLLKRGAFLSKLKKDYRRLGLEVGSIMIMVVAGGWLLWQVYSYFAKPKQPEPRASISKQVAVQTLPRSSSSPPPATPVPEAGKSGDTERRSSVSSASISKEAAPAPVPSPLPEVPKTPSVQAQEIGNIMTLLENVRQSNLKKDIDLFVSCYASDFENMEGRKRATIAYWEKFNYLDLSYNLKDLSLSVETAKARVEWVIKTSSRNGGQAQQNKSVLDVAFRKEDGKWKIREVKSTK
jgi:uncharacterized protein YbaR (Trm112 family)/ketosteroid isomerase-like protein